MGPRPRPNTPCAPLKLEPEILKAQPKARFLKLVVLKVVVSLEKKPDVVEPSA